LLEYREAQSKRFTVETAEKGLKLEGNWPPWRNRRKKFKAERRGSGEVGKQGKSSMKLATPMK
jgi:hypothetical protein